MTHAQSVEPQQGPARRRRSFPPSRPRLPTRGGKTTAGGTEEGTRPRRPARVGLCVEEPAARTTMHAAAYPSPQPSAPPAAGPVSTTGSASTRTGEGQAEATQQAPSPEPRAVRGMARGTKPGEASHNTQGGAPRGQQEQQRNQRYTHTRDARASRQQKPARSGGIPATPHPPWVPLRSPRRRRRSRQSSHPPPPPAYRPSHPTRRKPHLHPLWQGRSRDAGVGLGRPRTPPPRPRHPGTKTRRREWPGRGRRRGWSASGRTALQHQ